MLSNNQSDQYLVGSYLKGNNDSFDVLLSRHKSRIYAFIMSKVKNRDLAEDVFQDTFIKVINSLKLGKYNEEGKFLPWVMRIAHNLIIDHFRKNKKITTLYPNDEFNIFDIIADSEINKEEEMIKKQIHTDLRKLVQKLPKDQKEVLELRFYQEMSFKKISDITGVSINTALGRMRYALINLRKFTQESNIDLQLK